MPVRRDRHGRVVEEDTRVTERTNRDDTPADDRETGHPDERADDEQTTRLTERYRSREVGDTGTPSHYDEPTRLIRRPDRESQDETTVLHRPRRKQRVDVPEPESMADPVTGWLVVTQGPGKGQAVQLGLGRNEVGRSADANVRLDFGDQQISRAAHAFIAYDDETRTWYIQQGVGRNLVRLDDRPVLAPTPLPARSRIRIGATHLVFVPLCGDDFDWEDVRVTE